MLVWLWVRDDETGLLDHEFKNNDVFQAADDSFEPSIGGQEKKSWLIVKIPDPPAVASVIQALAESEYSPGPTVGDDPVIFRKRKYNSDWRTKFTAAEIAIIEDAAQTLPDGQLDSGGSVTSGVVYDKFTFADFRRK